MFIIDDLLFWLPVKGVKFIAEKSKGLAEDEIRKKNEIRGAAMALDSLFASGKITTREYEKRKMAFLKALMARFNQ